MTEQWVTMREAAQLLGTSTSRISRLAAIKAIEVREDRIDRRLRLVNVEEIQAVLNRHKR
jgi:hypothetical protein